MAIIHLWWDESSSLSRHLRLTVEKEIQMTKIIPHTSIAPAALQALNQMQIESERLFRDEVYNGCLGGDKRILRSTLQCYSGSDTDIMYYIDCFYINPKFADFAASPKFMQTPIVFIRTRVRRSNTSRKQHEWKSYFMTADYARKFWDEATTQGFIKSETKPLMAEQMRELLDYAELHHEVRLLEISTIESGCENDTVFPSLHRFADQV
jgi:hypothetical protein